MKSSLVYWLALLLFVPAGLGAKQKPLVVASASIFADMADNISGGLLDVRSIVPIGGDPHIYEPTPGDAQLAAKAGLILKNGLTFEGWLNEVIENSGTRAIVRTITEGIAPIESDKYKNATDPHAWMDARLGLVYIENIKNALIEFDPDNADVYNFNYELYRRQLEDLDSKISAAIQSIPERHTLFQTCALSRSAVSLLKNSRGEIDLRLPVTGTLDDPQFSVFGLVMKMLFNLIGKAITSPFALLGSALGGGEELSQLDLAAGTAAVGEAEQGKLKTLAQALVDRPALRLDIVGRADPATDLDGLRQAALINAVRAQKLKAMIAKGQAAPSLEEVEVGEAEYAELLKKAYRAADFKKERNMIGMVKDIPVPEMEALLRANAQVGDDDLLALARARAQAVRDWLAGEGGVPGERIFVLEPKVEALGEGGEVQFSLR